MFERPLSYKDIFNKRADAYHKAMLDWPNARAEEFEAILENLVFREDTHVIDIPAGGGYLANYLPKETKLIHLETSELFTELGHSGSTHPLKLCSLNALPIQDASVDIALSLAGLHHTEDKTSLFKEIFRCLSAGGKCVIADAGANSPVAIFLDGWLSDHNSMGHAGWYLDSSTTDELTKIGFTSISKETRSYHWTFSSKEEAGAYCKLMFGIDLANIEDIANALNAHLGFDSLPNGNVGLKWQLDFITATKP